MLPARFTPRFLKQLQLLRIKTRRSFLGSRQGGHVSPRKGHGIEFSDYRQYVLGDNPRSIDWGIYARTDRLYIKRFLEEQDLSVLVMIDSSQSMLQSGDDKWEKARDVALAFSYIALAAHDTAHVAALGNYYSPKFTTLRSVHRISDELEAVRSSKQGGRSLAREVLRAVSSVRVPGAAILISDCLVEQHEIEAALNILRAKNLAITVVHVLGERDIRPLTVGERGIVRDSETGEESEFSWSDQDQADYTRALKLHSDRIAHFCRASGIQYCALSPDTDVDAFVLRELTRTGILT